ncbi:hypothetical protein HY212_06515 [Candidatus Pacearchaeota archaeon]|nr:hypothetical protein [Candidatus Pacearchaeota archaeon]
MVQNRNKIIDIFIGNLANSIVHIILEKAIKKDKDYLSDKYRKEFITSFEVAKRYRDKINPIKVPLPEKDASYIKEKIIKKIKAELRVRILKGYENIDLNEVENKVEKGLTELGIL